jgi:hypothetical protein
VLLSVKVARGDHHSILKEVKTGPCFPSTTQYVNTSHVCKLLERKFNSRFVWILESRGLLSNYQCSIQHNSFSLDRFVTLKERSRLAFLTKQHLMGVFFNIEKAYHAVWKYRILQTRDHWNLNLTLQWYWASKQKLLPWKSLNILWCNEWILFETFRCIHKSMQNLTMYLKIM